MRLYIKTCLFFLLKKITVYGKENIPSKGPVVFIGNHQNGLIDAILIPTTNTRKTHFLARASAFKNKLAAKIMRSLNMIPVYRLRDGINTIEKNFEVFDQCIEILGKGEAIEIFAEGEHHLTRRILPLKKGFARIILGTLKKYPQLNITIVPVGLNFDFHLNFPSSVSIYYGNPIDANKFINPNIPNQNFSEIIREVSNALKKLTLHVDTVDTYDATISKLEQFGVNYLNPVEANTLLKELSTGSATPINYKKPINIFKPFHFITQINSVLPLIIWRFLKTKINDIIFTNTYRFALIATLFPLFYIVQTYVVYFFFNSKIALIYLMSSVLLGIIYTKTKPVTR